MARIAIASHADAIRGKHGDTVFTSGCGGATVRPHSIPADPKTASQLRIRRATAEFSRMWQTISDKQRVQWDRFARTQKHNNALGNRVTPTGISAFVGVNQTLAAIAAPPVLTPPPSGATVPHFAGGCGTLALSVVRGSPNPAPPLTEGLQSPDTTGDLRRTMENGATFRITSFTLSLELFGGVELGEQEKIFVRMTKPCSVGRKWSVVSRGLSAINAGNPYTTLCPDVLADYRARFGDAFAPFQQIGVAVKIVNAQTGRSGEYLEFVVRREEGR